MKVFLTVLGIALIGFAGAVTSAMAEEVTFTDGGQDNHWHTSANWNPAHPPTDEDKAIIPQNLTCLIYTGGQDAEAKWVDLAGTLTIGNNKKLTIGGRDGLTVQAGGVLRIGSDSNLFLDGGGVISLDGRIDGVGAGNHGSTVSFQYSHTYITTGNGVFLGSNSVKPLRLFSGKADTLVLGPGNAIHGTVDITVALINRGVVDPNDVISDEENINNTIRLLCETKIGDGDWQVTCTDCDENDEWNTMEVLTSVVGTGDLVVGHHGVLKVKRLFSLHGQFEMSGTKAKIEVDKNVLFDVDRFSSLSCPQ